MKIAATGIFSILIACGIVIAPWAPFVFFWLSLHWLGFVLNMWPIYLGIVFGLVTFWVLLERTRKKYGFKT